VVKLSYYGDPVARQSPRFFTYRGKSMIIDPQSQELLSYKSNTIKQLPSNYILWKRPTAVIVFINCFFKIPYSWSNKKKRLALGGMVAYTKVPDCDNIAKFFMDVIKGIIFEDDAQVIGMLVYKSYSDSPRVEISMQRISAV